MREMVVCIIIDNTESILLCESASQWSTTVLFLHPHNRGFLSRLWTEPKIWIIQC